MFAMGRIGATANVCQDQPGAYRRLDWAKGDFTQKLGV